MPGSGLWKYEKTIPVTVGLNEVTVVATDASNNPRTSTYEFTVAAAQPVLNYDLNGNLLSDGARTFTWDAKNRLKTVAKGGTTWKWDYDYMDRRVREYTNNALTKVFIWSGTEIVQERDGSNTIVRTHYRGGFSDGAAPSSGTKYQTLTDHLGNIREVLTGAGAVAARYDYTPYQEPIKIGTSTVDPTFLTIGRYQHHAGSGLELALYRAYDPILGRWVSRDPIGEIGGLNLYSYLNQNVVSAKDFLGLDRYLITNGLGHRGLAVDTWGQDSSGKWNKTGKRYFEFGPRCHFDGRGNPETLKNLGTAVSGIVAGPGEVFEHDGTKAHVTLETVQSTPTQDIEMLNAMQGAKKWWDMYSLPAMNCRSFADFYLNKGMPAQKDVEWYFNTLDHSGTLY